MFNKEEIRIAKIKNISLIYFFFSNELAKNDLTYLGLKIIYDDKKSLSYDYKSEYFNKFLSKVIEEYKKNSSNISFYNDESKEIMNNLLNADIKEENDELLQDYRNYSFFDYSLENNIALYYVKDMILDYLKAYFQSEDVEIKLIKGRNNEFIIQYDNDKNIVGNISKLDLNKYKFKFYNYYDDHFTSEGVITFGKKHISGIWQSSDKTKEGTNVYHVDEDKREKQISKNNEEIYYKNEDLVLEISDEELDLINKLISLCSLGNFSKIIKNTDNSYMLFDTSIDNKLCNERICFININDNSFTIILEEQSGVINEKTNNLLTKDSKKYSYYGKIELLEDDYILSIEKQRYLTNFSGGNYKKDIGKYNYNYYLVSGNNFFSDFEIISKLEPEEEIIDINNLKKLLKDR